MSETMMTAIIAGGASLMGAIIANISAVGVPMLTEKLKIRQNNFQTKRDNLTGVYTNLISIINQYPNSSPNDIMKYIEYTPSYSMERFDSVIKLLNDQIEHYEEQFKNTNINYTLKNDIDIQIANREYLKREICEIRDKYFCARDKYKSFCKSDKVLLELYSGQHVKNCLVEFEVIIHNVFISGYYSGDVGDPLKNSIMIAQRNLINSIRNDIGIN